MELNPNIVEFSHKNIQPKIVSPVYEEIVQKAAKLKLLSKYQSTFDYSVYRSLEQRFRERDFRGGIIFKTPLKLVNSHSSCQQCLYSFEIDTYGRGCVHDCVYCYAKAELTVHGYWNNPIPAPVDVTELWSIFYTVFETDKKHRWREVLEKRVPLRIGSMSDSFMFMDKKYGVSMELLKLLKHYRYPYIIFTRSDLVAYDEYLSVLDSDLAAVQFSISSSNDEFVKKIEPGAPSPTRRLEAMKKLLDNGIWSTIRLNPFFPIYPDGYFTDPSFDKSKMPKPFDFSSFECIDRFAEYGAKSLLAGMVRLSGFALNQIEKATGQNLRSFYSEEQRLSARDFHYSEEETRYYYERIKDRCDKYGIEFTTCYIGYSESQFWKHQDIWANKSDCCNAKGRVRGFKSDCRAIDWTERLRGSADKTRVPVDPETIHKPLRT